MLFNTIHFAAFFAIVLLAFFAAPARWRHPLLLISSYYFYMCWNVPYVLVIIAITLIDYFAALQIEKAALPAHRKSYLVVSILSNLGLLFLFKYADFALQSTRVAAGLFGLDLHVPYLRWLLPVGISFHTFQALSYTIEVYRARVPAERNLLTYALYVAFFPQMVAGPIERPHNLLPQFHATQHLSYVDFRAGLQIALWGAFKKVVIADTLATFVNRAYSNPHDYNGPILLIATVFFAFQIYCDFSGYSEMAIGAARMMGFRLMTNFRQPYFAQTVGDFWRRWHISLSSWFRDYLYIPIGGNRASPPRWAFNIAAVFLLSGLWHGANWTFVAWGGLHGLYLIGGRFAAPLRTSLLSISHLDRCPRTLVFARVCLNFSLVTVAWAFFRAKTVTEAVYVIRSSVSVGAFQWHDLFAMGLPRFELAMACIMILVLLAVEYAAVYHKPSLWCRTTFRLAAYACCVYAIVFFGVFDRLEFIYFQF